MSDSNPRRAAATSAESARSWSGPAAEPAFRLVRTTAEPRPPITLDDDQRRVLEHPGGLLRVLAGPGTGKTTTLVEAVAERVEQRGVPVERLLLLTFSRAAAAELRDRVTARLARTISEPMARTFHSYAFGLVRRAALERGDPPPRLLSGSEQEVTLRELFAGRLDQRRDRWPSDLVAATGTRAFTDELRELLMRAIERDLTPADLRAFGRRFARPDWVIAADILAEYLEVTSLKAPGAFDAAELIQRARWELEASPALLASERALRRRIFVDEYQDCDPAQIELLALLAEGADELVVIGDPDQAIYAFRGAEQNAMLEVSTALGAVGPRARAATATVSLRTCRRSGDTLLAASRRIANRLGGPTSAHRELAAAPQAPPGVVSTALFSSATAEAAYLATVLRRAHISEGVAWSQMAVLVRSAGPAVDSLRRGLASAGVPVGQSVRGPLVDEPAVAQLLMLLRCVARPGEIGAEEAESLLVGPIGRADPLQLVRMRRHLRRLATPLAGAGARPAGGVDGSLAALLVEPGAIALIPPAARPPVQRLRTVIEAGQRSLEEGASAEDVLWALWDSTGLSERLERQSHASGPEAARADRDLDAVLALFAEAATVAERAPGGGPDELYRWVNELQITDAGRAPRRVNDESVSILTAHASKGLEWEIVCLAGVQDGVWPNLRQRGSLLGADLLVDVAENRAPISSGLPGQRLAEERRLFYVACTRAKRALYVTALAGADTQPSRFIDELDPLDSPAAGSIANEPRVVQGGRRAFALRSVVAELRAALLAPEIDERDRAVAAAELARLAAAGVDGAHPDDWWGLAPLSTEAGIRPAEAGPVPIRPSKFEAYRDCELRALLSELGAVDASDEVAASLGTLVHSVAELAPPDATEAELTRLLEDGWPRLEFAAPWHAVSERARAQRMVAELASWLRSSRSELTELGREVPFQVSAGDAQLSGKVDRLERDQAGRLVVVDLKTTKSKPTQREVADHAQLAAYQFAVSEGGFTDGTPTPAGGARLLQLGSPTRGEQAQPALSEFSDPSWVGRELARIASVLRGNTVTARPGADCKRCPARLSCPAQNDGRQVTS